MGDKSPKAKDKAKKQDTSDKKQKKSDAHAKQNPVSPAAGAKKGKREKRHVAHGIAHVRASFNNTQVSITDLEGNVVAWSSAGTLGFKGSRKGTPFAAQQAGTTAATQAKDLCSMRSVDVRVKGPGSGRESAGPSTHRSSPDLRAEYARRG